MSSNVQQYVPFKKESASVITQKMIDDTLKLLGADKTTFSLGDSTHEGGNVEIYRDGSNNLALFFDADATSNTKALDIYGGVVFQNFLTVGNTTLNTSYPFAGYGGTCYFDNDLVINGSCRSNNFNAQTSNTTILGFNINVNSPDALDHEICMKIDNQKIICAQATGDGAGGVVGKRSTQSGGQCHAKTDTGAADYNPSAITSDYIITVDTTAAARAVVISTEDRDSGTAANPRIFIIKDIAGNAGANNITISLETAGNIDGAGTAVINANYGSVTLMIDGTHGYII